MLWKQLIIPRSFRPPLLQINTLQILRQPFINRLKHGFKSITRKLPGKRHYRYSDQQDGSKVIWGIISINVGIYLAWLYAENVVKTLHDSKPYKFMIRNFTAGQHSFRFENLHSLITAHFSHKDLLHLGLNMLILHSFGMTMIHVLGIQRFIRLYIVSGISTNVVSLSYKAEKGIKSPSLGASGCISGVMTTFALMFPNASIFVFIFPMPAWAVVGGLATWDLYQAMKGPTKEDAAGHIGGGLGGVLFYLASRI